MRHVWRDSYEGSRTVIPTAFRTTIGESAYRPWTGHVLMCGSCKFPIRDGKGWIVWSVFMLQGWGIILDYI